VSGMSTDAPLRALGAAVLAVAFLAPRAACAADLALDPARLDRAPVRYRLAAGLAAFPVPVVAARRGGLSAGTDEMVEIREKILYPLLERSPTAVAAIVLEWYPGQPDALGVVVLWADGATRESLIPRTPTGRYAASAYEVLLAKPTP
jgi:hypothetical protein